MTAKIVRRRNRIFGAENVKNVDQAARDRTFNFGWTRNLSLTNSYLAIPGNTVAGCIVDGN